MYDEIIGLDGISPEMVAFLQAEKTNSANNVTTIQALEKTKVDLLAEVKNFKQGNTLIKDSLGLEQVNADSIAEAMEKLKNTKGDDKLTNEINNLKSLLETANSEKESIVNDYESKISDNALSNSLRDLGVDALGINPMASKMMLDYLKEGATLDGDNIVYKKDGVTEYNGTNVLTPKDKLEAMKTDDNWKAFIKGDVNSGTGGRESNGGGKKPTEMSESERVQMFRDNPTLFKETFGK